MDRTGDCWEWKAAKNKAGYGCIGINGTVQLAHRTSYFIHHGSWPDMPVLHSCDNPACVNPAHLRLGDHAENAKDKMQRGRWNGGMPKGKYVGRGPSRRLK